MGGGEIGAGKAVAVHLLCCLSLGVGDWLARLLYSWSLVTHTSETLRVLLIIHGPIVIVLYSLVRRYREHCSFVRTVGRGLLAVPAGALVNAFGAIVLGAPIGTRPEGRLDSLVSLPAYGSIIGAWVGAWPMPLDWERPWQVLMFPLLVL
ncbi:phosphatidylinositol glycan, class F [Apostasia shenzhenica]|uniref:Phosphatidylinositol glycan, class F n=1 Tax=Apostasia shenzhenica TaxID=1088818 RepID=A0A2I0A991_9ASPA|nr:phosphatidylinositol glycan, class F [Apostasia shenzhenica]